MSNKYTVSIIMGIYNCEKTLGEAIDSILKQTFEDWQLIMCDDGSKDMTYNIAKSYVDKYPKKMVLLKNEKNMGLNHTLNNCLKVAQGKYIARMDGDDISVPQRLEKEVIFLEENPQYAVVSTEMIMFDEAGDWGKTTVIKYPQKEDFCKHAPFFCHAACMVRREVFEAVEGYTVDPRLLRVEDCHLWFKVYAKGYKGANLEEALYKMRDDRNATTRRSFNARLNGCYVMFVGFRMIKMPWYRYIYLLKVCAVEILKCILPVCVYEFIHKRKFK